MVKVLVSVVSSDEAAACCDGAADIIDVKNVAEGSLGANFPWIVREVVEFARHWPVLTSAALGDLAFQPGTASLAAAGLASTGVDFIKAGMHSVRNVRDAVLLMQAIVRASREVNQNVKIVAAGYADYSRFGGLDTQAVLRAAIESESDYVMLDTAIKDGGTSLFDALAAGELANLVGDARRAKIGVALAGSLRLTDLAKIQTLSPDIIGVRSAVCAGRERSGQVSATAVREFVAALHEHRPQANALPKKGV